MLNFSYYNPVRVEFGRGSASKITELVPKDAKVMVVYGGGSIKASGAYDQVMEALKNHNVIEFSGIEPNPHYETCLKAITLAKNEKVTFLLAVGGGSVSDATKFIAAASCYEGDCPWDILQNFSVENIDLVEKALPLGCVITLPATGSEMNFNSVISNQATKEKLHFASAKVFPQFSIIDPTFTMTLSDRQTGNGMVDTFVHTLEQYLTYDVNSPLQDRMAEGVLITLSTIGNKILQNPNDYEMRANISWCATIGLNGWLGCGVAQDWATHMMGHELTAAYGIDHARTLAIIMPNLWREMREAKHDRLLQYARRVWNIQDTDSEVAIDNAIAKTEEFFNSLKVPTKLSAYGVNPQEAAKIVRERFEKRHAAFGEHGNINGEMAAKIISAC